MCVAFVAFSPFAQPKTEKGDPQRPSRARSSRQTGVANQQPSRLESLHKRGERQKGGGARKHEEETERRKGRGRRRIEGQEVPHSSRLVVPACAGLLACLLAGWLGSGEGDKGGWWGQEQLRSVVSELLAMDRLPPRSFELN
ncbi:unnamed protein product [Calypogeia fissa]